MAGTGNGYNTFHGFDAGPAPPGRQQPGFAFAPPAFGQFVNTPAPAIGMPPQPAFVGQGWPVAATYAAPPIFGAPGYYNAGYPFGGQYPAPAPNKDDPPGMHLRNPTGGVGLPPGFAYLFPEKHCWIHVFRTGSTPPWQVNGLNPNDLQKHKRVAVPANLTVKELMKGLGCNNDDAKKNKLYEVVECGNGTWKPGLKMSGDDKDRMKKTLADFGWARDPKEPGWIVWLYLTKD